MRAGDTSHPNARPSTNGSGGSSDPPFTAQARYLFSLDFHNPTLYAFTFTPDSVLDYGEGDVKGRDAIVKVIAGMPGNRPAPAPKVGKPALRPAAGRHQIANIVLARKICRGLGILEIRT